VQQAHAELLLLRGEAAEARRLYQSLLQAEPASPKLWNELGVSCHQAGDLEEAVGGYTRSLELDSRYALAWNNLAVAHLHHGNGDAEAAFRSALHADGAPADGAAWRCCCAQVTAGGTAAYRTLAADPQPCSPGRKHTAARER
jgi:Flp pilus assembly protein TadD